MFKKFFSIFKKKKNDVEPIDDFQVGYDYNRLIKNPHLINSFSICTICLELVDNKSQGDIPDEYWCCPDCASEALEIPYENLSVFLTEHSSKEIERNLHNWRKIEGFRQSYKTLKEQRYLKLIELKIATYPFAPPDSGLKAALAGE